MLQFILYQQSDGDTNVVYKISPQLFSIPALTTPRVKDGGLLDIMVLHICQLFQILSIPGIFVYPFLLDIWILNETINSHFSSI